MARDLAAMRRRPDRIDVSVIICTYNRARLISDALSCLLAQETGSVTAEIIVVDNNSDDDTADVVRKLAADAPIEVRYSFEAAQGISYARNTGAGLSSGSVLAFTDDDVVVSPSWVRRIAEAFAEYGDVDCVGGKVLPAWPCGPPGWLTRDHWAPLAILDYGNASLYLDNKDPRCLLGANVAFRREAFQRLGGFSPLVQRVKDGIGSVEDHEFLIRFWDAGKRALYLPDLVAMAPVDPARLQKRYHRRWHDGNGHFHAVMRTASVERSRAGRLFDVPAHLYRQCGADAAAWLGRAATGRLNDAFLYETRVRFFVGFFRTRRREYLARATGSTRRRLAASMVSALHNADRRLAARRTLPRTVMFEAANPMLFDVFRPVYDRLSSDPRISLELVPHGREFGAAETFAAASGRHRIVSSRRAAWMKPDVYISTDLWSMTWLHRRTRRVHLFHGVAGKYDLDAPVDLAATVRTFDRLLFPNHDRLRRYVRAGLVDADSPVAVVAGYPKADCLVNGSLDGNAIKARLRLESTRPTVIYAPTWSPHSSLNTMGEEVITTLADAGLNVIVKLHACSYTPRGAGSVDWRSRLSAYAGRSNVRIAEGADVSPYLVASDLLITDHSTVGFEFMILDRPVVVLHQPALIAHAHINPQKAELLQSAATVVHAAGGLADVVTDELRRPARLSAARRRVAEELFYRPGEATDRVAAVIYELLELPPPAVAARREEAARAR